jgi:GT2 family glycosyltransferase
MARNNGGRSARGRGLLFLDDDMLASPTLVGEHARVHLEDSHAVVIGYISVPTTGRRPWVAWEDHHMQRHYDALKSGRRIPGPRDFYTGNVSVSAALFKSVNGFDTGLPRAEDLEMGYRLRNAGARFYHRIAAGSLHLGQHSFEGWARNAGLYGQADVILAWEKGHIELQKDLFNWYHARRRSGRVLVELFSAHPRWLKPAVGLLNLAGRGAYYPGLHSISRACYGTIHHLNYWLAIIQALGPERFWKGVEVESVPIGVGYDAL